MNDMREFSKLPRDPAYWSDLEAKIVGAVSPSIDDRDAWWMPLARGAWRLGGLAAAAALATLLLAPARQPAELPASFSILGARVDDPTLASFVTAPTPPRLTSLLVQQLGESR